MELLILSEPGLIVSLWRALFYHHLTTTTVSEGVLVSVDVVVGERGAEPEVTVVCVGRRCYEVVHG